MYRILFRSGPPSTHLRSTTKALHHDVLHAPIRTTMTIRQRARAVWHPQWNAVRVSAAGTIDNGSDGVPREISAQPSVITFLKDSRRNVVTAFLPKGYPQSVSSHYRGFVAWQFLHNVAGSVTGVLSTQSLLFAIGLGAGSIPLAASLNWIIKDGLGQLGGVLYASSVSDRFDSEPKRYRFQATLAMQLACAIEIATPLFPGMFLAMASVSNVAKNIAWLATSASRAHMHKTFALRNNLGDITGKSGSQSTAAGLIGTGIGILVSSLITYFSTTSTLMTLHPTAAHPLLPILAAFLPFTALSIYGNYRSNLYVTTCSLNIPRAEMILASILMSEPLSLANIEKNIRIAIPTPEEVSNREVFATPYHSPFSVPIVMEPAVRAYTGDPVARTRLVKELEDGNGYFLVPMVSRDAKSRFPNSLKTTPARTTHVALWFIEGVAPRDLLRGFYHAAMVRREMEGRVGEGEEWVDEVMERTRRMMERTFEGLKDEMERKGWEMDCAFLTDGDAGRLVVEKE